MQVMKRAQISALSLVLVAASFHVASGQAVPYRGLWIGDINLTRVNEVTAAYDENNTLISPDPKVPTPTSDSAQLRLILHVNGAGQVSLLKDVAVLNRAADAGGVAQSDSDVSLVTDERLYGEYPPQPALRVASALFDFCDSRATEALDAVVSNAAVAAAAAVEGNANLAAATKAALSNATPVVAHANVADAFYHFITESFKGTSVTAIAQAADPASVVQSALIAASNLQSSCSFYPDSRGVDMINAVVAAVSRAGTGLSARVQAAQNAAASYADVNATYQQFIAGKSFGDMIAAAAASAATGATNSGATVASLRIAVNSNAVVNSVSAEAVILQANNNAYSDTRASTAVEIVLTAVINAAMAARTNIAATQSSIKTAAEQAGRSALASDVARYPISIQIPTIDYTSFVSSPTGFLRSAGLAATNAAKAARDERTSNALWTRQSLLNKAILAASAALRGPLSGSGPRGAHGVAAIGRVRARAGRSEADLGHQERDECFASRRSGSERRNLSAGELSHQSIPASPSSGPYDRVRYSTPPATFV